MNFLTNLIFLSVLIIFVGCQTTPKGPVQKAGSDGFVSRGDLEHFDGHWKLPQNYKQETSFSDMSMNVFFDNVTLKEASEAKNQRSLDISENQKRSSEIYLETMMGKIRRFDIKMFVSDAKAAAQRDELADIGEISYKRKKAIDLDYSLSANMVLGGESYFHNNGKTTNTYKVTITFSVTDIATKSLVGSSFAVDGQSQREYVRSIVTGKYLAGYSSDDEALAIKEAIFDAMKKAMKEFAEQFPVSGKITRISEFDSKIMGWEKGSADGLSGDTQVCLWYDDQGAGIPIAYGNCQPGENDSTLNIYKWNDSDPKYRAFIERVQQPGWLAQNNGRLYATSLGLPYPKEWDSL
jgi:hypothetical protein